MIHADPASQDSSLLAHCRSCKYCNNLRLQSRRFERSLESAAKLPVPEGLSARILLRQSNTANPYLRHRAMLAWCAVLIVVAIVGFRIDERPMEPAYTAAIAHHLNHTIVAPAPPVVAKQLNLALRPVGIEAHTVLDGLIAADPCVIDASPGAHLVIDGAFGPVSILFLPNTATRKSIQIEDQGVFGLIAPCQRGSIAIFGQRGERFEMLKQQVDAAITFI